MGEMTKLELRKSLPKYLKSRIDDIYTAATTASGCNSSVTGPAEVDNDVDPKLEGLAPLVANKPELEVLAAWIIEYGKGKRGTLPTEDQLTKFASYNGYKLNFKKSGEVLARAEEITKSQEYAKLFG